MSVRWAEASPADSRRTDYLAPGRGDENPSGPSNYLGGFEMSHDALGVTVSTDVCTSSSWTRLTLKAYGHNWLRTDGIRFRKRVGSTHRRARRCFPSGSSRSSSISTRRSSTRQSILLLGNGWLRSGKNRRGRLNNQDKRRLLCGRSRDRRDLR